MLPLSLFNPAPRARPRPCSACQRPPRAASNAGAAPPRAALQGGEENTCPLPLPLRRLPSLGARNSPEARLHGEGSWGDEAPKRRQHSFHGQRTLLGANRLLCLTSPGSAGHAALAFYFLQTLLGAPVFLNCCFAGNLGTILITLGPKITTFLGTRGESPQTALGGQGGSRQLLTPRCQDVGAAQ